jgi:hypothetical protein
MLTIIFFKTVLCLFALGVYYLRKKFFVPGIILILLGFSLLYIPYKGVWL